MKKILLILFLLISSFCYSQVRQTFGAVADNLDSLRTHVGKQNQYVVVLGRDHAYDSLGAIYAYDSNSTVTEIPNIIFKVTGKDTGRWKAVYFFNAGSETMQQTFDNSITATDDPIINSGANTFTINSGDFDAGNGTFYSQSPSTLYLGQSITTGGDLSQSNIVLNTLDAVHSQVDLSGIDVRSGNTFEHLITVDADYIKAARISADDSVRFVLSKAPVLTTSPTFVYVSHNDTVKKYPISSLGGGTVTSVATNNGSGITGGTITTTGTIAADTTSVLSTKAHVTDVLQGYVPTTRTISTTSPLSGGGDLSANRTISLGVVPIANGGTNNGSLSVTAGTVYYGDGTKLIGLAPGTSSQVLHSGTTPSWKDTTASGTGTVTSFSAGNLSPLFTTSVATATTTPALTFALSNAAANTVLGNATGGSTTPSYGQIVNGQITNATIVASTKLSATGTPSSSTFLRGDDTWAAPSTASINNVYAPLIKSGDTISQRFNVLHYGATGDSVTDDGPAIQAAINACDAAGGGVVFFPKPAHYYRIGNAINSTYNAQLFIPTHTDNTRNNITLMGEAAPNFVPVGGGLPSFSTNIATGVVRLVSTLTTFTTAGQAVIGCNGTLSNLMVQNLAIQVKNNPAGAGPVVGGINWSTGYNLHIENVVVYIDTSGNKSTLPTNNISGIETPNDAQGDNYVISNTLVIGFHNGYKLGEHVTLNSVEAWCCYYGINWKQGAHASQIVRPGLYWNFIDMYWSGLVYVLNSTFDNEFETVGHSGGKWYDNAFTIKDTANLGRAIFFYNSTAAGGGFATATKSGGNLIDLYRFDSTAFPILRRATNTFNPGGASAFLDMNTTLRGGYATALNGVDLWTTAIQMNGVADKNLSDWNYKLNRAVVFRDSLGNVNIAGSNPNTASTSALSAQVGGNVYVPTTMSIGQSSASVPLDILSTGATVIKSVTSNSGNASGAYLQNTNTLGTITFYMENNRGSFASYGGGMYGGATNASNMFGISRADRLNIFADGASNLGMGVGTLVNQPLVFGTNNLERVRILGGGNVLIGTSTDNSKLTVNGSVAFAYVAKTANYTATASDYLIDCTTGTFTVTLPTAASIAGRTYKIVNSGSGTITIGTTSSQTFVNITSTPTTLTMGAVGAAAIVEYTVTSNGANWIVTGKVKNE